MLEAGALVVMIQVMLLSWWWQKPETQLQSRTLLSNEKEHYLPPFLWVQKSSFSRIPEDIVLCPSSGVFMYKCRNMCYPAPQICICNLHLPPLMVPFTWTFFRGESTSIYPCWTFPNGPKGLGGVVAVGVGGNESQGELIATKPWGAEIGEGRREFFFSQR